MANEYFKVGKTYTTEEIKKVLGSGNYMQVVVHSHGDTIRCIRFRADRNPKWKSKNELWIYDGAHRIPDAQRWIETGTIAPIFCGKDHTNNWTYQGAASASLLAIGEPAAVYTGDKNVGLVLHMKFKSARSATVSVIRREKVTSTFNKKRAA